MDHSGGNFASTAWAAVLGHHAPEHTGFGHHGMPMDLHVSQFPYYRCVLQLFRSMCNSKLQ